MRIGLIGPPQSGKSTLFSAMTGQALDPAQLLQEHSAVIKVPDARLDELTKIYNPKKTTEAAIDFVDFPGISSADDHGKEQYKKHLPGIRKCDLLVSVVRAFDNPAVPPHNNRIDAQGDLDALQDDFIFADLETVTNRIDRLQKASKKPTKTADQDKRELALLERCVGALEELQPLSTVLQHPDDEKLLRSFAFLTQKPVLVVVNVSEEQAASEPTASFSYASALLNICCSAEAEIAQLDLEDRAAFLEDLGIQAPARDRLIQTCYTAAGLISFLTAGEDEVRAWTIRKDSDAVEAASKIHSDIARGFIRAETVAYADFMAAKGDMKAVKAGGKLRQEGKTYVVQDGDIINFKFNV